MKQTAVEWYTEQLRQLAFNQKTHLGMGDIRVTQGLLDELLEQAKAMEKEQIIEAFDTACEDTDRIGKEYYDQTYKKNE
jgi:hypothetical protein